MNIRKKYAKYASLFNIFQLEQRSVLLNVSIGVDQSGARELGSRQHRGNSAVTGTKLTVLPWGWGNYLR